MPDFDLNEQLSLLYEFQQIDTEILVLHGQLKSVPIKIKKLEDSFQVHRQKLQQKDEELKNAEKEQRSKTAALEMLLEQRRKHQARLHEIKTNKEYEAADKEISFLSLKEAELEDEILAVMLRIDQLRNGLAQQQEIFNTEQAKNNAQKVQYEQEAEALKSHITACQEKRHTFYPKIDRDLMNRYQEWFKRQRTGLISLVADNACGNCHLTIPPQTLKEARKNEQLIHCGSCKCILYVPPPPPDDSPSDAASSPMNLSE